MDIKMSYRALFRSFVFTLCLSTAGVAGAQVTITSPAAGQRLPAGPDYATDVLADPWDMSNVQDMSPDPNERGGFSSLAFSGGRLNGTISGADAGLAFLYRGFYGLPNPGRNGVRFPIDPNAYRKLSFKMSSTAVGENVQLYWFHRSQGDPAGDGFGVRFAGATTGGEQVFVADMITANAGGEAWNSALVRGLRIDPNSGQTGQQISFDWIRLTAPDGAAGAAMHTISWTGGSGNSTIEVVDAGGAVITVATGVTGTSFAFNYGVLPPGAYTLRVRRGTAAAVTRAFSINNPPILRVTDPDESGGADYATDVLHNAWDMAGPPDVAATANVAAGSYSGGQFHATNTSGDAALIMLNASNNGTPIDSKRYRYLTFDLQVDGAYNLGIGSVARVFWTSQNVADGNTMTTTKDIIVFPGLNHYSIDLGSLSTAAGGGLEPNAPAQGWTVAPIRHLRIDPHEFAESRQFHLGAVKLAAVDEGGPSFTIRFTGADADGDAATVALYYDTNTNPLDGRTLIANNVPLSAGSYVWNAAGVPVGTYYVYAVASDGIQSYGAYSTGAVAINGGGQTGTSNMALVIDTPRNTSTVSSGFTLAGWAIDRGAATGPGVDVIHVYAYPNPGSGAAAVFLGQATYGGARGDIGAAFGAQFTNSGFGFVTPALATGSYQIVAFARSTVTGGFTGSVSTTVQVIGATAAPAMALDGPANNSVVTQPFALGGWAIDAGAPSGTGVDTIHVWAYPNPGSGAAPIFVGVAGYGWNRPDIGAAYGGRFAASGFGLTVGNLAPGTYQIIAYAHSTVTGTFNNAASAGVRISNALLALDNPLPGATVRRGFAVGGWTIDNGAPTGTGIDAVHVWAWPTNGAAPIFAGQATMGGARPDVARLYGSRFTNSGYNLIVTSVPAGVYDIVAYGHSTVTGAFSTWKMARVVVQ
jgi:hypothetical protein